MSLKLTPGTTALSGVAVVMACACGAGANSAKLLSVSSQITHSALLALGGVLIFAGLWQVRRLAAAIVALAFVTLVAAAALTPPMTMSASRIPWFGEELAGAGLYTVFAVMLAYAFWISFASPRPSGTLTAMTGTAVASGCTCCMVTGALAGTLATMTGRPDIFMATPVVFFTGIAIAGVGLSMIRGWRPIPWLLAGALLTQFGGRTLALTGDWMVGGVNLRFIPGYIIYLAGAGLVMTAWAVAYDVSTDREQHETAGVPEPQPSRP